MHIKSIVILRASYILMRWSSCTRIISEGGRSMILGIPFIILHNEKELFFHTYGCFLDSCIQARETPTATETPTPTARMHPLPPLHLIASWLRSPALVVLASIPSSIFNADGHSLQASPFRFEAGEIALTTD